MCQVPLRNGGSPFWTGGSTELQLFWLYVVSFHLLVTLSHHELVVIVHQDKLPRLSNDTHPSHSALQLMREECEQ